MKSSDVQKQIQVIVLDIGMKMTGPILAGCMDSKSLGFAVCSNHGSPAH
jgi:hypothetical protein